MFELVVADKSQLEDGFRFYAGRLVLGAELEFLRCSADRWRPEQYRQQWVAAAKKLSAIPVTQSAFVTSVARGRNNLVWWVAYRRGGTVVLHNQMLGLSRGNHRVAPKRAHLLVKPKVIKHGQCAAAVSEWRIGTKELKRWLQRAR